MKWVNERISERFLISLFQKSSFYKALQIKLSKASGTLVIEDQNLNTSKQRKYLFFIVANRTFEGKT